jgi:hypothetical protein
MRWSKLKQLVEQRMAPAVNGRVRIMVTSYRRAHDQYGRWAFVIDGEEIAGFDTISSFAEIHEIMTEIASRNDEDSHGASDLALAEMRARAHHPLWLFIRSLHSYLNASIDDCIASDDAVVRALGFLDSRLGKRRLVDYQVDQQKTDLERACLSLRLVTEKIPVVRQSAG